MPQAIKVEFVIAVNTKAGCYGVGNSRREAYNNCNRQSGRNKTKPTVFYYFGQCKRGEITISPGVDLEIRWPDHAMVMRESEGEE